MSISGQFPQKEKNPRRFRGGDGSPGLLVFLSDGVRSGPAGNEDLNDRVAAQAVTAVDTAGDFARGVEAGDDVAFGVQHMAFGIRIL